MDIKDSLERLRKANEKNKTPITVNRGLLKSALMEIELQRECHGESFATRMVVARLKDALGMKS
ncbi:hypothetical protein DU239_11140 [Salmonella enterica subsp. enterica]|nr:hypothetical protein [Salmonella enterica subsp. enterica serovar Cerro]EBZ8363846.1 hypothetical protein [Salmonella enterica subsp. enterica serovar Cerro]EBZ8616137.1 hypothetical protein [Salmonella enterica subsp. enterica serovar Cerro]ECG6491724.1 hypothetical protein [Salmonella enterica subsp. enterica serovar Cerro]EDI0590776.1 hypothetical protein [Salmonella enterica subsp. enterica serovar Cerro]